MAQIKIDLPQEEVERIIREHIEKQYRLEGMNVTLQWEDYDILAIATDRRLSREGLTESFK